MDEETLNLLVDLHIHNPRQGPGSSSSSQRAIDIIKAHLKMDQKLQIADIGCGTGNGTQHLANSFDAQIYAIDFLQPFLSQLEQNIQGTKAAKEITTLCQSMDNISLEPASLDLIWSEGAIYNIGFEKGIQYFKKFLKPKGIMAISEITWTTKQRPDEINDYWQTQYPQISTADHKIKQLSETGLSLIGYFTLDASCWLKEYYSELETNFESFLAHHQGSDKAKAIIEAEQAEITLYRKYQDYYSYGFYIAQKC